MSRSGYSDDCDNQWDFIRWRGAVKRAMRGGRGLAFLREMLAAMDALPEHKLIADSLEAEGAVCALGAVGKARGVDMAILDPEDFQSVAATFGVAPALVQELEYWNDDMGPRNETPEDRFARMHRWIKAELKTAETSR